MESSYGYDSDFFLATPMKQRKRIMKRKRTPTLTRRFERFCDSILGGRDAVGVFAALIILLAIVFGVVVSIHLAGGQ